MFLSSPHGSQGGTDTVTDTLSEAITKEECAPSSEPYGNERPEVQALDLPNPQTCSVAHIFRACGCQCFVRRWPLQRRRRLRRSPCCRGLGDPMLCNGSWAPAFWAKPSTILTLVSSSLK